MFSKKPIEPPKIKNGSMYDDLDDEDEEKNKNLNLRSVLLAMEEKERQMKLAKKMRKSPKSSAAGKDTKTNQPSSNGPIKPNGAGRPINGVKPSPMEPKSDSERKRALLQERERRESGSASRISNKTNVESGKNKGKPLSKEKNERIPESQWENRQVNSFKNPNPSRANGEKPQHSSELKRKKEREEIDSKRKKMEQKQKDKETEKAKRDKEIYKEIEKIRREKEKQKDYNPFASGDEEESEEDDENKRAFRLLGSFLSKSKGGSRYYGNLQKGSYHERFPDGEDDESDDYEAVYGKGERENDGYFSIMEEEARSRRIARKEEEREMEREKRRKRLKKEKKRRHEEGSD